jgi:hypothetical protein
MTMNGLLDDLEVRRVPVAELPHPESVRNVNVPDDLAAALARPAPLVRVATAIGDERTARAATLGTALGRDGQVGRRVTLNGVLLDTAEPGLPLVEGDVLDIN